MCEGFGGEVVAAEAAVGDTEHIEGKVHLGRGVVAEEVHHMVVAS